MFILHSLLKEFKEENGLFDIWLPLVRSFQNVSKSTKETILIAESNVNAGFCNMWSILSPPL